MWQGLWTAVKGFFGSPIGNDVMRSVTRALPYYKEALQVVIWIAKIAQDGKEDLAQKTKVELPEGVSREEAMAYVGLSLLKERFPEAKDADLKRALEIAVGVLK